MTLFCSHHREKSTASEERVKKEIQQIRDSVEELKRAIAHGS